MGEAADQVILSNEADKDWLLTLIGPQDASQAEERLKALHQKLRIFFTRRGCLDAENLAQETVLRATVEIKKGRPLTSEFEALCFGIARNVALEDLGKSERKKQHHTLDEDQEDSPHDIKLQLKPDIIEKIYQGERLDCLRECLKKMPECGLALSYHQWDGEKQEGINARKKLAAELGLNQAALRSLVLRLREKLECCIESCLGKK